MIKYTSYIKRILQSETIKQPMVAAIVTIVFTPFSVYLGFHLTSILSRPILSIEYAYVYREKGLCKSPKIIREINNIISHGIYTSYKMQNAMRSGFNDMSSILYSNSNIDPDNFTRSLVEFKKYVLSISLSNNEEMASLNQLSKADKTVLAIKYLSSRVNSNEGNIDKELLRYYEDRDKELKDIINRVDDAITHLNKCNESIVYINLSVLNNGATDGLVRNRGELKYHNNTYLIERSKEPSNVGSTTAVPTYVVNKSFNRIESGSVGKIEKNSMVELWYKLVSSQNFIEVCNAGGEFEIILFDQNKSIVDKKIKCSDAWR